MEGGAVARVRPLGDRVLVRVLPRERQTAGGVHLPDTMRDESDRGVVIAVGPGASVEGSAPRPVEVHEGEIVLFSPYAGSKVAVGTEDFLLLREADVLGVLEGVAAPE